MGSIYKITNTVNGKSYIGQTIQSIEARFKAHLSGLSGTVLKHAIAKYGAEAFRCEPIHQDVPNENLDNLERKEIKAHNTLAPNGYNLEAGGHKNKIIHPETRKKIGAKTAIAHKGMKRSSETRLKMSQWQQGRKLSPEHRKNIGESQKGKKISPEAIEKTASFHRGRKRPPEVIENIKSAQRRRREREKQLQIPDPNQHPCYDDAYQMFQSLSDDLPLLEKRKILVSEFEDKLHWATLYKWIRKWSPPKD